MHNFSTKHERILSERLSDFNTPTHKHVYTYFIIIRIGSSGVAVPELFLINILARLLKEKGKYCRLTM